MRQALLVAALLVMSGCGPESRPLYQTRALSMSLYWTRADLCDPDWISAWIDELEPSALEWSRHQGWEASAFAEALHGYEIVVSPAPVAVVDGDPIAGLHHGTGRRIDIACVPSPMSTDTWLHEVTHAWLAAAGDGDQDHTLPVWDEVHAYWGASVGGV